MITTTSKDGSVTLSYVGCVVAVTEESVQVMSDIFEHHTSALVFDNETGSFKSVFLYSDYGGSFTENKLTAVVDATESILALYEADQAVKAAQKALDRAQTVREEALREARRPGRGKTLKVVSGRKIPKGTVGECTFYGEGRSFRPYSQVNPWRVGMKVGNDVVYTDAHNVEVVLG